MQRNCEVNMDMGDEGIQAVRGVGDFRTWPNVGGVCEGDGQEGEVPTGESGNLSEPICMCSDMWPDFLG